MNKRKKTRVMIEFIVKRLMVHWKYLVMSLISLTLVALMQFITPQINKTIFDEVIINKDYRMLVIQIGLLLGVTIVLGLLNYISSYFMTYLSQKTLISFKNDIYKHLLHQDFNFFETSQTGDLMTRLNSDVRTLQDLISSSTLSLFASVFTFVIVLIFMFIQNWVMSLLIILTFPILFYLNKTYSRKMKATHRKSRTMSSKVSNHLQTSLSSVLLIKNFALENENIKNYEALNQESFDYTLESTKLSSKFSPLISFVTTLGTAIVLGFGSYLVMEGSVSVGEIIAFQAYLRMIQTPIRSFASMGNKIQQALVSFERIEELLDVEAKIVSKDNAEAFPRLDSGIVFSDVNFAYDTGAQVLSNINFELKHGEVTALVGSSGSGKSTLTKLMSRLYDPSSGDITVDGYSLKDLDLHDLRNHVGIVSQDIQLIDGTLRDNILLSDQGADEAKLREVCTQANIMDFIDSLPNGFDTQVGERGIKLSGGQKQRISIARVFLKDAPILILDEATASLDNESEKAIQMSLDALIESKTCLVIAHRLSTIHKANTIVVLDHGKIIEQGNHNELLKTKGRYHDLYQAQFA